MDSTQQMQILLQSSKKRDEDIYISATAKTIDSSLLEKLIECIDRTNSAIATTSALPGQEANAETIEKAREQVNSSIFNRIHQMSQIKETVLLKLLTLAIKAQNAGNCYEFSFLGQERLQNAAVQSEIFRIRGKDNSDSHIFLVVNRNPATIPGDFTSWNQDAIIVDPYLKKIYVASEIPSHLQSCVYNETNDQVKYIPFDVDRHQMDNKVRQEFIEDWQGVLTKKTVKDGIYTPEENDREKENIGPGTTKNSSMR